MEERVWHKAYDKGIPPALDLKDIPLHEFLDATVERHPNANALQFLNCTLTYKRLKDQVDRIATAMAALGIQKGDRVAIHLPNLPQTVISFLGVVRLGAIPVMTNPLYVAREIIHQWNDSGCTLAITTDFLYEQKLQSIRNELPLVKNYIVASVPEYLRFPMKQLAPLKLKKNDPPLIAKVEPAADIFFFRKLIDATEAAAPRVEVAMEDVAVLQYTGGTTGVSKGAVLTHANLSYNVQQIITWFSGFEDGREVILAALPFFHIFGVTVVMLLSVYGGANMAIMPNPRDIPLLVKSVAKRRVTLIPAVPAMFHAFNSYPGIDRIDVSSVKFCVSGSAPLPLAIQERFEALTGSVIMEGFGLTETSPVTHCNPLRGVRKVGGIGVPLSNTDAKIVDAEDAAKEMPIGEPGELIVEGPQVTGGYWNRPDESAELLRNGWLHTGDLAVVDEDGYFKIVGRKKDMIVASGYNIYPDEIDDVLLDHPAVAEACTIGIPDMKRGETVKSFVTLVPGQSTDEEALFGHCRERMAAYKIPREIEFREELPRSSMMKLLRRVLRDEEIQKKESASDSA